MLGASLLVIDPFINNFGHGNLTQYTSTWQYNYSFHLFLSSSQTISRDFLQFTWTIYVTTVTVSWFFFTFKFVWFVCVFKNCTYFVTGRKVLKVVWLASFYQNHVNTYFLPTHYWIWCLSFVCLFSYLKYLEFLLFSHPFRLQSPY